jgi:hypothetical protein
MAKVRRVVLLGNSVVASSLASTLRNRPELDIHQLVAPIPETVKRLRDAHPDAIILCELATTPPDLIFRLLGEYPDLLVIGVDIDGDRMVVLSSRQSSLRTEDDLLEAIRHARALPRACERRPEDQGEEVVGPNERSDA